MQRKNLLAAVYLIRAVAFLALIVLPGEGTLPEQLFTAPIAAKDLAKVPKKMSILSWTPK